MAYVNSPAGQDVCREALRIVSLTFPQVEVKIENLTGGDYIQFAATYGERMVVQRVSGTEAAYTVPSILADRVKNMIRYNFPELFAKPSPKKKFVGTGNSWCDDWLEKNSK